jgi:alanyl-tRNA synthetase
MNLADFEMFLSQLLIAFQYLRSFDEKEILRICLEEIKIFKKTLQNGIQILQTEIHNIKSESKEIISGETLFKLYDTYGFPIELSREIAIENGLSIDQLAFKTILEEAREKSRQATQDMFKK